MKLKRKFETGEFAVLAEMEPPKGVDVTTMVANAKRVKDKVDEFVVPEMSNAVMRMSSLGGAMVLRKQGLPALPSACPVSWRLRVKTRASETIIRPGRYTTSI
jgi:methylenetetrahydrofolate reductase (NADPH)